MTTTTIFSDDFSGSGSNAGRVVEGLTYVAVTSSPFPPDGGLALDGAGFLTCPPRIDAFHIGGRNTLGVPALVGSIAVSFEATVKVANPALFSKISFVMSGAPAGAPNFDVETGDGNVTVTAAPGLSMVVPVAIGSVVKVRSEADPDGDQRRFYINDVLAVAAPYPFGDPFDSSTVLYLTFSTGDTDYSSLIVDRIQIDTGVYVPPAPPSSSVFWTEFVSTFETV